MMVSFNAMSGEIPFFEAPFSYTAPYVFPGPEQALQISTSAYHWLHKKLDFSENGEMSFANRMGIFAADMAMSWLPLGNSWLHEEWHRSVMARHKISSYNDVYNFNIGAETIAVSHVTDADLTRFKAEAPADFVRLQSAGMESQLVQNQLIEKRRVFDGFYVFDEALLLLNYISTVGYVNTCSSDNSTAITNKSNIEDGTDISKRDFTGLDCVGWVYDLFRPDESYTARGTHPSGVGINRYRKLSDLTSTERDFLGLQSRLSFLNFINPMLFGVSSPWALKHYLTSFGYAVDLDVYLKSNGKNVLLQIHDYQNPRRVFLGLSAEFWRVGSAIKNLTFTYGISIWEQPEKQRFDDEKGKLGGKILVKSFYRFSPDFEYFASISAKTLGWVAGDLNLDSGLSAVVGISSNNLF